MRIGLSAFICFCATASLFSMPSNAQVNATSTLCATGVNTICSTMPADLHDMPALKLFGYVPNTTKNDPPSSPSAQTNFDYFAWQSFVALNWPADSTGNPSTRYAITDTSPAALAAPRIWSSFEEKYALYPQGPIVIENGACEPVDGRMMLHQTSKIGLADFTEAFTPYPLIDQAGNFVLYDVRVNSVDAEYVRSNGLNTKKGQKSFKEDYNFTPNKGPTPGSIELKSAWRILTDPNDFASFFTMPARISISEENSQAGPLCIDATVGLVGMHIMQKFSHPERFSEYWSWATFEHAWNAPLADDAPVSQFNSQENPAPFSEQMSNPPSCELPPNADIQTAYSFYDPQCHDASGDICKVNAPPVKPQGAKGYKWAAKPPYAEAYLIDGKYGTQVARCFKPYASADIVSEAYQSALKPSAFANYRLIGMQWAEATNSEDPEHNPLKPFPAPFYLTNTTMETYIQIEPVLKPDGAKDWAPGSCITCHNMATDTTGKASNFSFLPRSAK